MGVNLCGTGQTASITRLSVLLCALPVSLDTQEGEDLCFFDFCPRKQQYFDTSFVHHQFRNLELFAPVGVIKIGWQRDNTYDTRLDQRSAAITTGVKRNNGDGALDTDPASGRIANAVDFRVHTEIAFHGSRPPFFLGLVDTSSETIVPHRKNLQSARLQQHRAYFPGRILRKQLSHVPGDLKVLDSLIASQSGFDGPLPRGRFR